MTYGILFNQLVCEADPTSISSGAYLLGVDSPVRLHKDNTLPLPLHIFTLWW
jgi:hypothetical protein